MRRGFGLLLLLVCWFVHGDEVDEFRAIMSDLPVICIGLEKRVDRWNMAQERLAAANITNVERFLAVDGRTLSHCELRKSLSHRAMIDLESPRDNHQMIATRGAVGCYLSHVGVWRRVVEKGAPYVLILEDDFVIADNFQARFVRLWHDIKQLESLRSAEGSSVRPVGTVHIGYIDMLESLGARVQGDLHQITGPFFGTHSYVISLLGARALLSSALPAEAQLDAYIGYKAHQTCRHDAGRWQRNPMQSSKPGASGTADFEGCCEEMLYLATPQPLLPQHSTWPFPSTDVQSFCWKCKFPSSTQGFVVVIVVLVLALLAGLLAWRFRSYWLRWRWVHSIVQRLRGRSRGEKTVV